MLYLSIVNCQIRHGDRVAMLPLLPSKMYQGVVAVLKEMPDVQALAEKKLICIIS